MRELEIEFYKDMLKFMNRQIYNVIIEQQDLNIC